MQPTGPNPGAAWPVLYLIGAKKPPVDYSWLLARVTQGLRRGSAIALEKGEVVPVYNRERVRNLLDDLLRQLESVGVITIQRSAGVPLSVIPVPNAFRRFWWSQVVVRLLLQVGKPTEAARRIASAAGVEERSAWRWMKGETTPNTDRLQKVLAALFVPETRKDLTETLLTVIMNTLAQAENCGLTPAEKRRGEKYQQAELQPLAELVQAMRVKERAEKGSTR